MPRIGGSMTCLSFSAKPTKAGYEIRTSGRIGYRGELVSADEREAATWNGASVNIEP